MNLDEAQFFTYFAIVIILPIISWAAWAIRTRSMGVAIWAGPGRIHSVINIVYYSVLFVLYITVLSSSVETSATTLGCCWVFVAPVVFIWNVVATILVHAPDGLPRCVQCGYCLRGLRGPRCPECGHELTAESTEHHEAANSSK